MSVLAWLIGCSSTPDRADGTTTASPPSSGGFEIRSGSDLVLLATVVGPGDSCARDAPPLALGDLDGDGVTDLAMTCRDDDGVVIHLLDGAAALGGTLALIDSIDVDHYEVGDVPDIDGDGVRELAFGEDPNLSDPTWTIRPSTALDTTWTIHGLLDGTAERHPVEAGDLDGDGVPDLAVWQERGDTTVSVVSGAALRDHGAASVSAPISAISGLSGGVEFLAPAPGGALVVASDPGEFYGLAARPRS